MFFSVLLQLGTLLGLQLAVAADVLQCLVDIDVACRLVEQSTTCIEAGLDVAYHLLYGRELDNGFAELLAVACIGDGFVVCSLTEAHALGGNAEASAVHQRHYIFNKA